MCIIMVKKQGQKLDFDAVKTAFKANSDGAGLCYVDNKEVIIKKGFMDINNYIDAINDIPNIDDKNVVLHMRIATHGNVNEKNCHPFPLSNCITDLQSTNIRTDIAVIHNGIIDIEVDKKHDLSDTMTYIKNKLYPRYKKSHSFYKTKKAKNIISKEIGYSKIVMLDSNDTITIINESAFHECNGILYSNYSYIDYTYDSLGYGIDDFDDNDFFYDAVELYSTDYIYICGEHIEGEYLYIMPNDKVYYRYYDDKKGVVYEKIADYAFDENRNIVLYEDRV